MIAYIDIGAHKMMVNLKILLSRMLKPHREKFKAADDEVFCTNLIKKQPFGIKFLMECVV